MARSIQSGSQDGIITTRIGYLKPQFEHSIGLHAPN